MVQVSSSLPNRIAFAKNNKVRLQSCITIGATIMVFAMFCIESNVYRQIIQDDKNSENTFLDHHHQQQQVQYQQRRRQTEHHYEVKQNNLPTSRNGFVTRGSLRSSTLIVDVDKFVLEQVDQKTKHQHHKTNKIRHPAYPSYPKP